MAYWGRNPRYLPFAPYRVPFLDGRQIEQALRDQQAELDENPSSDEDDSGSEPTAPASPPQTLPPPAAKATLDSAAATVSATMTSDLTQKIDKLTVSDKDDAKTAVASTMATRANSSAGSDMEASTAETAQARGDDAAAAAHGAAAEPRNEIKKIKKRKVLLMGKSGSGKSSMRSIIFSNYLAKDTRRLGATIDIDLSHVKFLGNLTLNLWDCGGQEAFMENYLSQQRMHIFSNVGVLIYVFDIESRDVERDLATYAAIISALVQYSASAKVFVLLHKMDLILGSARESVFDERVRLVRAKTDEFLAGHRGLGHQGGHGAGYHAGAARDRSADGDKDGQTVAAVDLNFFATSIWDQSLYKAWASIIHDLIPNLGLIETNLGHLGQLIEAEEILLFERTSFLVVSFWNSAIGALNPCDDRFERMSNIMKTFKSSLAHYSGSPRNAEQFRIFELKGSDRFSLFIAKFTTNTYILVCLPPGEARYNSALLNTHIAARQFEYLDIPPGLREAATGAKDPVAAARDSSNNNSYYGGGPSFSATAASTSGEGSSGEGSSSASRHGQQQHPAEEASGYDSSA